MQQVLAFIRQYFTTNLVNVFFIISFSVSATAQTDWSQRTDLTPTQIERLANSDINYLMILRDRLLKAQHEIEQTDRLNTETKFQIGTLIVGGVLMGLPQFLNRKDFYEGIAGLIGAGVVFAGIPVATKVSESFTTSVNEQNLSHYPALIKLVGEHAANERYTRAQQAQLDTLYDFLKISQHRMKKANSYSQVAYFLENVSIFITIIGAGSAATGAIVPLVLTIPLNGAVNLAYVGMRVTGEVQQAKKHRELIKHSLVEINSIIKLASANLATYAY